MTNLEKKILDLVEGAGRIYRSDLDAQMFEIWLKALCSVNPSEADVQNAFDFYFLRGKKMPCPADIVEIIIGKDADFATFALTKVKKAIDLVGPYESVAFDDPVIHATLVEIGGWVKACSLTDEAFVWWQKDFLAYYQHFLTMMRRGLMEYPKVLYGINDRENVRIGYERGKITYIGDRAEAIRISTGETSTPAGLMIEKKLEKLVKTHSIL